ncbi:hypothetical protein E2C01_023365 [Portunus trituberculatus]|uniref:Uncharacterized protein n=1 Tax=Portunus trituberculatus TaxID=210409 RepID=A0A5B7E9S8_PORTR|nr:hypothetical protein [Portunus trituberculatus]
MRLVSVAFGNSRDLNTILIICLVFYVVYTFTALFLTYGACTGIRSLLLPWLIVEVVPFGFQVVAVRKLELRNRVEVEPNRDRLNLN